MMVVMVIMVVVFVLMVMMMSVLFIFFLVMVFMLLFIVMVFVSILVDIAFQSSYPACSGFSLPEVKHISIKEFLDIYLGVVTLYDLGLGLNLTDNLLDFLEGFRLDLGHLVQEDDVAELNLLDDKVFDILVPEVLALKAFTASELVSQPQCIYNCDQTVKFRCSELSIYTADGLH